MRQDAQLELKQDIIQKRRGVCGNLKLRRFRRKEMMDEWGGGMYIQQTRKGVATF